MVAWFVLFPGAQLAAQAPAAGPRYRARIGPDSVPFRIPAALRPGGRLAPRTPPALMAARWAEETETHLASSRAAVWQARLLRSLAEPEQRLVVPPPAAVAPRPEDIARPVEQRSFEALTQYADLGLDMNARLEMKMERLRNVRCSAAELGNPLAGCSGGFPAPSLDQQFSVRAGGIVSDRVHVNVDFDSEREFNANNNINVFYQGLDDEIVRRVDVGTVTFRPPASRFITASIPANSFGVQAAAQIGPLELRSIVAQQKGSALRTRTFTVGEAATQPVGFAARDLDFEFGRFFFVINPREITGYPDVDPLDIRREDLTPAQQVAQVRVYRLRAQSGQAGINTNLGGIDAVALRPDSPQQVGPFSWELLVEGQDYYLDPSGSWFGLGIRAGNEDFLAVSYVTVAGDTVGTFPSINGTLDTLELIYEPRSGPDVPTFYYEMRNVYRLGGQDIDRSTIDLAIVVNNSETPVSGERTYLSLLGLALPTDPSTLDEFNRVFPRVRDPGEGAPIRDRYVMLPHLTPFADNVRLDASERNDSLYRTPTYLLASQGPAPKLLLQIGYDVTGAGDRTTLNLGALQVRARSERLSVGGRQLVRGVDYEMDYAIGQVTFLRPDDLFAGPTPVEAAFEENQLFDGAPKNILGFSSTYDLGGPGTLNAIGIFQSERTISNRPQLGFEPEASFIGGLSTELQFRPDGITRFLDGLPFVNTTIPSTLRINGEVATSRPNSNRAGAAYIEDFDTESSLRLGLDERIFQLGSAPSSGRGIPLTHLGIGGGFSPADAVPLVWQNLIQSATGSLQFRPQDIDSSIALVGTGTTFETVLWLSLKPDTVGGAPDPANGRPRWIRDHTPGPRWRSLTQPLGGGSGVGVDLTRTEFLEFWVLEDALRIGRQQDALLVFDFGRVFEDAVAPAPQSFDVVGTDTVFGGLQFAGLGRLDTEKDSLTNVYNARIDDTGIREDVVDSIVFAGTGEIIERFPLCDLQGVFGIATFPLGDLLAQCSRGNGFLDTEDLNGDNRLDVNVGVLEEGFVRHVFPLGDERFYVRDGVSLTDGAGRTLTWRLYRLPFREDTLQVGQPNLRQIQAVRLTVVAPDQGGPEEEFWVALARARLVGAPWLKRASSPIAGLSGNRPQPHGEVIASIITTQDSDLGYESPPGIRNLPDRKDIGLAFGTQQINEKSLRLLASDVRLAERAEAFLRFADAADKNFLKYRQLRVWARGRGVGWEEGDLEFFVKAGLDEHNFFMYKTPVRSTTWEPEVIVDIERWIDLRTELESAFLRGEPPGGFAECGGDSTAYVTCDGPYFVQMRDPGTSPPNLARVSEVAVGFFRAAETVAIGQAELWIDDIRLTDVVDEPGIASALDIRLNAADVAEMTFAYSRRDDQFRQLGQDPSYITDAVTRFGSRVQVDKFLPESWGLNVPFRVQHLRTSADPLFISQTDIRGDRLDGLRRPRSTSTLLDVSLQRATRGESFLARTLLDPIRIAARREVASNVTSRSAAQTENQSIQVSYLNVPRPKTIRAVPGLVTGLIEALPSFIRDSEFGRSIRTARLRWNPQRLRFASTLTDNRTDRTTYRVPVELASDSLLLPSQRIAHSWRNTIDVALQPFSSLNMSVLYESTRDLRDYGDSTSVGRILENEQRQLLGANVGFERTRFLTTSILVNPAVSAWLRPRLRFTSSFVFNRDPNGRDAVRVDSMGGFRAPETVSNARRRELGATVDVSRLARGFGGDSGFVARVFRGFLPADVSYDLERRSAFSGVTFTPGVRYHLALGGLGDFRARRGTPATSAAEITGVTATGGTRLPLGLQVRFNYRQSRNTIWSVRGARQQKTEQRNREWPSVAGSWVYAPRSAIQKLVSSVSGALQYRIIERSNLLPALAAFGESVVEGQGVLTENNSKEISPSFTVVWTGGVSTTASYSSRTTERVTSGNITNTESKDWTGVVAFAFRPPRSLVRLRNQVRTTVSVLSSKLAVCLLRADSDECRSVSDSRRRQVDVRLDSGFSETLRGGATFSYTLTDVRHTSDKLSQIVFSIFFDVRLLAGEVR